MLIPEIANIRMKLLQVLPKDPNEVSGLADRLQKLAKYDRAMTDGCSFSKALQMRRLIILPLKGWKDTDARVARNALEDIERLKKTPGHAAAIQLACYGVEHSELAEAVKLLEQARGKQEKRPAATEEHVVEVAQGATVDAEAPAKKAKSKARPKLLESLDEIPDAELDEQTKADLDALEQEVRSLKNK